MIEAVTNLESEAQSRSSVEQREHERKEVAAHYEHHPEIFQLVLDKRLAYATGIFETEKDDLETAQARKYATIADQLHIQPGDKVLDVGCGWGSNLLYLAEHTGGECRGITLSAKQREVALARAAEANVDNRLQIDLMHAEELDLQPNSLDAVLFVGAIVHMHHREAVHASIGQALKPGGRLLISDCYFPREVRGDRNSSATQYIFVKALGYCRLIRLSEELSLMEEAGLDITTVRNLTDSYVHTLNCWINNVRRNRAQINEMSGGFAKLLQTYMTVAKLSFMRRTALEYLIVATKGPGKH